VGRRSGRVFSPKGPGLVIELPIGRGATVGGVPLHGARAFVPGVAPVSVAQHSSFGGKLTNV